MDKLALLSDDDVINLRCNVEAGCGGMVELTRADRNRFDPPAFLVGSVTPDLLRLYYSQHIVLGTTIYNLRNASVLGEGMIITNGQFNVSYDLQISLDYLNVHHRNIRTWQAGAARRHAPGQSVLLAGPGHLGYGHWIVDFLPKIYLLQLAGYKINRLTYLLPSDIPNFARVWLALLNVEPKQCRYYDRTREIVDCDELLVPSTLRFGTRVSPLFAQASAAMRQAAIGRTRVPRKGTKIFISRPANNFAHNNRTLIQRQLFRETARSHGFVVVSPELLSIPEQVALFQCAETIVGEYGSGLHSSMFSRPGALVMAARDNQEELGFLQSGIDGVLDHQTGYLIGAANLDGSGAFSLEPADITLAFDWMTWRRGK